MKTMGHALDISEAGAMEAPTMRATHPDEPIVRTLNVSVRGNLSDMTSNPSLSLWQPTQEALAAMFQKAKYTNLKGNMENKGDLKSVILHSVSVKAVQSDFPFAIGAKITGVDESTFTRSGKAFSAVFMPKESSHAHRVLQKDNVEVGTLDLLCLELFVFLLFAFAIAIESFQIHHSFLWIHTVSIGLSSSLIKCQLGFSCPLSSVTLLLSL